ncbi:MAG: ABC transporter substrate binding protein [Dialister sp.]
MLLAVIAAAIFIFIVHDNSEAKQKIKPVPHKSMYQVTLFQENSFPVHEKMKQGIIAALESKGFTEKKNIHLEIINGQGNLMQMETQAKKIVHEKPDLIISVGTEATKAVVKETEVIPVVGVGAFQMKSEPAFEEKYNLTGIGDMPLILNQVRMASKNFSCEIFGYYIQSGR